MRRLLCFELPGPFECLPAVDATYNACQPSANKTWEIGDTEKTHMTLTMH